MNGRCAATPRPAAATSGLAPLRLRSPGRTSGAASTRPVWTQRTAGAGGRIVWLRSRRTPASRTSSRSAVTGSLLPLPLPPVERRRWAALRRSSRGSRACRPWCSLCSWTTGSCNWRRPQSCEASLYRFYYGSYLVYTILGYTILKFQAAVCMYHCKDFDVPLLKKAAETSSFLKSCYYYRPLSTILAS